MPNEEAAPILIFMICFLAFATVLLYALARSWSQALSTRPDKRMKAAKMLEDDLPPFGRGASFDRQAKPKRVDANTRRLDVQVGALELNGR